MGPKLLSKFALHFYLSLLSYAFAQQRKTTVKNNIDVLIIH